MARALRRARSRPVEPRRASARPDSRQRTEQATKSPRNVSTVGWIVGSLKEREAALELLQNDADAEPRDELGIGPLRDALANAFFPGITTLQTRAKYFLLIPAMYAQIEADPRLRRAPHEAIAGLEADVLKALLAQEDTAGVIGSQKRRVPLTPASAIYWSGLHTWGIRRFSDSRPRYHSWLRHDAGAVPVPAEHGDDEPEDD